MSIKARRELLAAQAERYQKSTKKEKQAILDEFVKATGYQRKYAIRLLNNYEQDVSRTKRSKRKPRAKIYNAAVKAALLVVWEATNPICSKRLVPFIPEIVTVLERLGYLSLDESVKTCLLTLSPSTVDRLLSQTRAEKRGRGLSTTKPGALLKRQIAIRSFADWDEARPGFMESDLVAHCGTFTGRQFLQTLFMTDIATGWTEFTALPYRDADMVIRGLKRIRTQIPFTLPD
jgi:hypothetical protein